MELVLLGTGTCSVTANRSMAAHLIKTKGANILLDCGPGAIRRLSEEPVPARDISAILVSHLHLDHVSDIPAVLFCNRNDPFHPKEGPLAIFGPVGLASFMKKMRSAYGESISADSYKLAITEITPSSARWFKIGESLRFRSFRMSHGSKAALGYRIEERAGSRTRTMAYTGDTDTCLELHKLAKNADLLLCECSMPDGMKISGHLTASEAGEAARLARAKKLVLTHMYPPCAHQPIRRQAAGIFGGEVIVGADLMRIKL